MNIRNKIEGYIDKEDTLQGTALWHLPIRSE